MNPDSTPSSVTQDLAADAPLTRGAPTLAEFSAPDKYEMLDCLGRGGCGVVFKARDKALDRLVALKFLVDARPSDLERFRREARITARLNDPAIVQVFEFGGDTGHPYIAMQFLEGGNLATARLTPRDAVLALRSVAEALGRAHAAGIVHRDVKPANVLLDAQRRAFLSDFGLARELSHADGATISRDGALVGTPALMAPEQARGDLRAIDARTDIYSLGASLYVLLCGRYPFVADTLVDLLHAVIREPAPPPRSVNPEIDDRLEQIIIKCMHKDRSWRYRSMGDLIADLDAYLADRMPTGVTTSPLSPGLPGLLHRRNVAAEAELYPAVAVPAIRQIAAWDTNLYRVGTNLARLYPQLDSIIERLDEVLRQYPHCAWARFYRGAAQFRRGRLDQALEDMECSFDRMGAQADAQFEMGRLYLAVFLREGRKAHRHLSRMGTRHHLSGARGRLHQAAVCFREAQRLRNDLSDWQLEFTEAVARLADANYDGCIEVCDRILARDADLDDVWRLRGDAQRFSGHDPSESYDQALRVRRSDYEALLGKAEAHLSGGRFTESRACLQSVLEIQPSCVEAMTQLARASLLEFRNRKPESSEPLDSLISQAAAHAAEAAKLRPEDYEAAVIRAELLTEKSRIAADESSADEALSVLESAKKLDGCQNRVLFLKSRALLERARLRRRRGASPAEDLATILTVGQEHAGHIPDNDVWLNLIAETRQEALAAGIVLDEKD